MQTLRIILTLPHPQRGGRGVLLTSSERDDRMGQNQNPKKTLDQNLTPKKFLAEFPSHNSFQKAETVEKQVLYFICGTNAPGVRGSYNKSS